MSAWQKVADTLTKMPHWLARPGSELDKMRRAAVAFWSQVETALRFPAKQIDPLTAELELVHLLAWERNITRLTNEPETLYRKRVAFALVNAKEAGSTQGVEAIMGRLGLPVNETKERQSGQDWDIIAIDVADNEFNHTPLIPTIVRDYGRTCRRYTQLTSNEAQLTISCAEFNADYITQEATCP